MDRKKSEIQLGPLMNRLREKARRKIPEMDVEDLVQEVLVVWVERMKQGNIETGQAYAEGILRHKIYDYYQKRRDKTTPLDATNEFESQQPSPEERVVWMRHLRVIEGLANENRVDKALVRDHFVGGAPLREVATNLDVSAGAVNGRLFRFRQKIMQHVGNCFGLLLALFVGLSSRMARAWNGSRALSTATWALGIFSAGTFSSWMWWSAEQPNQHVAKAEKAPTTVAAKTIRSTPMPQKRAAVIPAQKQTATAANFGHWLDQVGGTWTVDVVRGATKAIPNSLIHTDLPDRSAIRYGIPTNRLAAKSAASTAKTVMWQGRPVSNQKLSWKVGRYHLQAVAPAGARRVVVAHRAGSSGTLLSGSSRSSAGVPTGVTGSSRGFSPSGSSIRTPLNSGGLLRTASSQGLRLPTQGTSGLKHIGGSSSGGLIPVGSGSKGSSNGGSNGGTNDPGPKGKGNPSQPGNGPVKGNINQKPQILSSLQAANPQTTLNGNVAQMANTSAVLLGQNDLSSLLPKHHLPKDVTKTIPVNSFCAVADGRMYRCNGGSMDDISGFSNSSFKCGGDPLCSSMFGKGPGLALNRDGSMTVLGQNRYRISKDGGNTWSSPTKVPSASEALKSAWLVLGQDGTLWQNNKSSWNKKRTADPEIYSVSVKVSGKSVKVVDDSSFRLELTWQSPATFTSKVGLAKKGSGLVSKTNPNSKKLLGAAGKPEPKNKAASLFSNKLPNGGEIPGSGKRNALLERGGGFDIP